MTNPTDMLFSLLRLSLDVDKDKAYDSETLANTEIRDWEQLFDFSVRQGVLLLSYGGLQYLPAESQPPRKLKLRWCVNVIKGNERYDHYKSVIVKLSNLLSDKNIGLLLIKGVTISELYPVPYLRESGDIDIYLLEKARQIQLTNLMLSLGIKKEEGEIPKHSTFVLEGIPIENHNTFFDTALPFRKEAQLYQKMESMLNSIFSANDCPLVYWDNICQLPPQAAALYFIGHTFRHFCCLDMNIRQMCDWAIFFTKYKKNINGDLLSSQIDELGLRDFVCHVNLLCANKLGFKPYFIIPSEDDIDEDFFILKTIMQYRVNPKVRIPVLWVLHLLFRRNNVYKRYLEKVRITEFLLPEINKYLLYLLRYRWRTCWS